MSAHLPRATPSVGPFVVPAGTATIWTANGDIQVAECKSRSLSPAGNAANAQLLALSYSAIEQLRVDATRLEDAGLDASAARALVSKAEAIGKAATR